MSFRTNAGKMTSEEVSQLIKIITLYGTGRLMKSKSGLPRTHEAESLKAESNDWKQFIK